MRAIRNTSQSQFLSRTYRVRPGDNLSRLAQEFGVELDALIELNRIEDARLIWVGQVLMLPRSKESPSAQVADEVAPPVGPEAQDSDMPTVPAVEKPHSSSAVAVASAWERAQRDDNFPWIGRVKPWSAALRDAPRRTSATLVDVPRGTEVVVTGSESEWLRVQVELGVKTYTGYVSRELLVHGHSVSLSLREALVVLKRVETASKHKRSGSSPAAVGAWVSAACKVVQATGRYAVDGRTYTVSFAHSKDPIKINTIEDFILFVEEVERI
ncbi:MAG: LysM domain-containing protein [Cystobacter sp.]